MRNNKINRREMIVRSVFGFGVEFGRESSGLSDSNTSKATRVLYYHVSTFPSSLILYLIDTDQWTRGFCL